MTVLFVCQGNVARSQEAAAFLEQLRPDISVMSAGIAPEIGKPLDPLVIEVMKETDISLPEAVRKLLTKKMVHQADVIVSFIDSAGTLLEDSSTLNWDVEDPKNQSIDYHRHVRDEIREKVAILAQQL